MPIRDPSRAGEAYRPSNGTEGMKFEEKFCNHCRLNEGCPMNKKTWICLTSGTQRQFSISRICRKRLKSARNEPSSRNELRIERVELC